MATKKHNEILEVFPPNVPPKLIEEYRKIVAEYNMKPGGYQRKLAARLRVNMKYLNDLLIRGIEPTYKTKKGREAREKLFLRNDYTLQDKEEVIETLEELVRNLQNTIRRLRE